MKMKISGRLLRRRLEAKQEQDLQRDERRIAREIEAKKIEQEHELETLRLKAQIQEAEAPHASGKIISKLKIPPFEDGKDNLDAYLLRFERYVRSQNIEKKHWALHLSTLLRGKALEVYSRMSTDDALNYDALITALQKRYRLTEDGFRIKFRTCKPERRDTCAVCCKNESVF